MSERDKLTEIRERIDELDREILRLISERARCAQQIAQVKTESGSESEFYRPEREAQVLRRIAEQNPGPLSSEEMARLFREIMSACLALEQPLTVSYLGPEGTFTQAAVFKHFGHSVRAKPLLAIDEVFREVEAGSCHYGVVPIENSTEGVVNHTLDMFLESPLRICGEVELRIHHLLLSTERDLQAIETVYSHQQSLAQCREWLDANLPGAQRVTVSSNAQAARRAAQEPGTAAIAGEAAAELYELEVLKSNIEDHPENTTRFLVVGRHPVAASDRDKTSVLVSAPNRPGALFKLLEPFARNQVSLTRIESRPSHCVNWEYVFFFDMEGHVENPNLSTALRELADEAELVKVLGSYPRAVL